MILDLQPATVPLRLDEHGTVRVGGTRVTLESVLHAWADGESADGIAERFPTLDLADIHATIAWYLRHRDAATQYLESALPSQQRSTDLRARLLARRCQ